MQPLVSVIIPNYKNAKYINDAINSVIAQNYNNWEMIIINDGGEDIQIDEDIRLKYGKMISVISTKDIGLSACRMEGYYHSSPYAKWILYLDADDKIDPTFLEKTVEVGESSAKNIGIIYTDTQHFGDANTYWDQAEYNFHDLLINNYICSCSLLRKEMIEDAGGFDLNNFNYYEDYEFWIACGARGWYGKHIPEKLFWYRIHKDSGMQSERESKLGYVYKAYIVSKFPELYDRDWVKQSKDILTLFPSDFMKWKPSQQEEYIKENNL
jgi:glycosyltransferase involved in cell wall biosynthesis